MPEDFTVSSLDNTTPQSFSLFEEASNAQKTMLSFITQVFKNYNSPIHLVYVLLDLIEKNCKITDFETFKQAFESFKAWGDIQNDIRMTAQLVVLFGKIDLSDNVPNSLHEQVLLQLCKLLLYNEQHYNQYYVDLLSENTLIDLCTAIIERLQPVSGDTKLIPALKIAGYGKEAFEEVDNGSEEFCTFHRTGTNYEMQHWYYCYTCKLVANKGTCNVCAKKCHAGHQVVYSRKGNFFCDCGDNQNSCKSMPKGAKRKNKIFEQDEIEIRYEDLHSPEFRDLLGRDVSYFTSPNERMRIHDLQIPNLYQSPQRPRAFVQIDDMPQAYGDFGINLRSPNYEMHSEDIDSDEEEKKFEEDSGMEIEIEDSDMSGSEDEGPEEEESRSKISSDFSEEEKVASPKKQSPAKKALPAETREVCDAALGLVNRTLARISDVQSEPIKGVFYPKMVEYSKQLSKVLCNFKAITSPLKVPYTDHRELKDLANKYPGIRNTLAVCPDIGVVLLAEGNRLLSLDSSLFHCTGTELERSNITILAKNVLPFYIMNITVNPVNSRIIAVSGINQCVFIQLSSKQHKGNIEKKISLSLLSGESKLVIVKLRWIPGSQTELVICTTEDIRIFDFSRDIICPIKCFRSLANDLTDLVICRNVMISSSSQGILYRQEIVDTQEPLYMSESINMPSSANGHKILSISYIDQNGLLLISLISGKLLLCKFNETITSFTNDLILDFQTEQSSSYLSWSSAALTQIIPAPTGDSLVFVGLSRKNNSTPVLIKISDDKCTLNPLKKSSGYVEGICIYSHANKHTLLSQYDDGSLLTNSILLEEETQATHIDLEALNKYLTHDFMPQSVTMPITYFEKAIPLNGMRMFGSSGINRNEVILSGDPAIAFGNSKIALEKLSFDRNADSAGLVSTALPDPSTINISLALEGVSASTVVLCGFKIFIETGPNSHLEIFNRKIQLQYQKRWYDLPLCDIEIVKGYLNHGISLKIVTQNPGRHPIRLFHFEIFGFNQASFGIDTKLSELSKAALGIKNPTDQIAIYKHLNWKKKFAALDSLQSQQKELIVYLNALGSTLPPNFRLENIINLIGNLSIHNFSAPKSLYSIAIKDSLKNLLASLQLDDNYTAIKALVLCWALTNSEKPSEKLSRSVVKSLSHLIRDDLGLFFYLMNCYSNICQVLDQALSQNYKLMILDDYLKVLLYSCHFFMNKTITDCIEDDKIAAMYHISPTDAQAPINIIIKMLRSENSAVKEQIIAKVYQHTKKHTKMWIKQVFERSAYTTTKSVTEIYEDRTTDISAQMQTILNNHNKREINIYCGDICYLLMHNICED